MKISIIIPVFNVEKYLEQCINSVLQQSYHNFEVILVDDGSTDSSGSMCDSFAQKDTRVKVIHKTNGGLSDARNVGIKYVSGEYIMFLDSDDYWDSSQCLEFFVSKLRENKIDILTFRYKKYIESEKRYVECLPSVNENEINSLFSKNEILRALLDHGLYLSSACNKILRTDFIKKNNLYFKVGITSEDIDWCARCMIYVKHILYMNIDCYVYRQRDYSISHNLKYKNMYDLKNNIIECVNLGSKFNTTDEFYDIYYTFVAYQYGVLLLSNHFVHDTRMKGIMDEMKAYRWLLSFNSNKKIKILYCVNKILGYRGVLLFTKIYSNIRKG